MSLSKEQVLEIVKTKSWNIQGFNGMPLYLMSAATDSGWLVTDVFEAGYTHFFYFFSNGRAYMYYDEQDWDNICAAYYQKITSQEQLETLINEYKQRYQGLVTSTSYDINELSSLSQAELVKLMQKLCSRLSDAVGAAHAIEGITFGTEKNLRSIFKSRDAIKEQEFGLICSPIHPSFLSEAQKKLWQIKNVDASEQKSLIADFITNYGWIENTYLGAKNFTEQDVINRAQGLTEEPPTIDQEELAAQKEAILNRFHLSNQERFMVTTIELCFHWQDERKKHILQSIGALEPVVTQLSQTFGIDMTDLKFMTPVEVTVVNLSSPEFAVQLQKRRQKSVYYTVPERNYIFTNGDYEFFSQELHMAFDNNGNELKGVVASPGVVQGVVKVCESVSDIDKVQTGEVLVASMTRPEYLPAMQKAVAFVTDEGGITSHAAIVAREMKKPCVIGTRIATKVLKDGDLVEVDANKGIVRKL